MNESCIKAQQTQIGAAYFMDQLIIWAEGEKPTRCHTVRVQRWPFRIYPPQYEIIACTDPTVVCPDMIAPYRTVGWFSVSEETFEAMGGVAVVHHSGGIEKVPVHVVSLSEERRTIIANRSDTGQTDLPFSFSKLLETGRAEDIDVMTDNVGLHFATGYSNSFSFTEAFQDAIANLPPDRNHYPDKLINVKVTGMGGNFGSIAGLHRLFVNVSAFY